MVQKTATRFTQDKGGEPGQEIITTQKNNNKILFTSQAISQALEAVTAYREKGIHTFPLSRDKIPLVTEWNDHDFSLEQHRVDGFSGIGTCPGRWADNVMVFDIDGAKGRESWAKCVEKYGPLPDTYTVTTGRVDGGTHLYYKVPDGLYVKSTASKFTKKVDLRGTRGQAVLPPTVHRSGKQYQWHWAGNPVDMVDPDKIPLLPEAWVKALIDTDNAYFPGLRPPAPPPRAFNGNADAYASKAMKAEANLVLAALDGTRNVTLNNAAFSLGQLIAGGELDHGTVQAELLSAALSAGLPERKSLRTIESGFKGGAKSPRTAPELTHTGTWERDGCDCTQKEPSHLKAIIDGSCDSCDGCDGISEDKKTFSLPEPPLDAFHPDIKAAILNIAETKQSPVEVPLSALLALVSGMVGRARCITIKKGWSEPGNTFIGLVAKSGVGKSPATNSLFRPVYQIEKKNQEKYRQEMDAYEMMLVVWQKKKDPDEPKPQPPGRKDIILDDWTIESAADALITNPKGILLYRDELAGMLLDLDKYTGEKGSTKTRLMTAYDAKKPWKISRINSRRAGYIQNPCISLYGGIQDQVACQLFSRTDQDSGFLGRFIFIQAIQKNPSLFTEEEETEDTTRTIDYLVRALEKIDLVEGNSKYIGVKEEAKGLYIAWHDALSREAWLCVDDGETGLISKVRAQGLRICLLLHIIEKIMNGENEMDAVSPDTMSRALSMMNWLQAHTKATWQMLKQKAQAPTGQAVRVAQAIYEIQDQIKGGWLSTRAITEQTNKAKDARFHLQSAKVGRICTSIGLENKPTREAKGFLITPDDLTRLSEYLPTKKPSQPSQLSQAININGFGVTVQKNVPSQPSHRHTGGQDDVEFF